MERKTELGEEAEQELDVPQDPSAVISAFERADTWSWG